MIRILTILFVVLWIVSWALNAFTKFHFDLGALQTFYLTVLLPKLTSHAINSKYNSPQGIPPNMEEGGQK